MATITLYRDEQCTDIVGSGLIGAWTDIFGGVPGIMFNEYHETIDGKSVTIASLRGFDASRVKQGEPTEIVIPYTETNEFQKFYITPECGFTLKVQKTGTNSGVISNGVFFRNIDGVEHNFGVVGDSFGCNMQDDIMCKLVFRTGEKAHYNSYGTDVIVNNTNFFGFDVISYDQQGREEQHRGYMIIAPSDVFITDSGTEPYKPETGNRSKRSGTGTGYYPNNPIPALPTESINAAFSAVLGRGNGLTYYRMDGDCLEKLTEFLYDTTLTLKFRNSEFREAVASIVFIPYNVTADVINHRRIIYLANKGIYPNSPCDVITRPFREIDFGYVDLTAANVGYKTFADYTQTTATLYLPAYGAVNIDMSAFAGGLLHLRGVLDVRNGNILYRLESQGSEDDLPTLYGQYTGNCGLPVPIGGANASPTILGAIASIGTVATRYAKRLC